MLIRRPQAAEAMRLRELRLRALHDAPYAFAASPAEDEAHPPAEWERWAQGSDNDAIFIAEDDHQWVGMIGIYSDEAKERTARVWGMWVAPDARGGGAGRELLDAAIEWGRDTGALRIELCVTDEAKPAATLYAAAGFQPTGARGELRPGLLQSELALDLT